ncbi:hypothetical protein RXV94_11750 [Yeosuana sp. MJ-SS3]|uniref:Uncharacterized protein n=1 Tax=Gilvirhabdus luticola TaxID=3079858 RepID=A0ABU3U8U9_9FLAO|nr:hypothetical protein [Yeosuana sp. MJ-SS3]MDU8886837.1 hypothetical protein [Yeosuana sp. MJ-SS3]
MRYKKSIKLIAGIVIFFTLPSFLFLGFVYFKYNEDIPFGIQGEKADVLAKKMLDALDYDAYVNTNYIEWTFKKKRHYKWYKNKNTCLVYWKEYKVDLNFNDTTQNKAYIHNFKVDGNQAKSLINEASTHFKNDVFWLIAPYDVFNKDIERRLVTLNNGGQALLVTYKTQNSHPQDSYLWILDKNNKPKKLKMWTTALPIDGLEASWNDWIITESGAQLPTFHSILIMGFDMGLVKGTK